MKKDHNNRRLGERIADWLSAPGGKLRSKLTPASQAELRKLLTSPKAWLLGADITDGHVTPWELFLFAISGFLGSAAAGFSGKQDFLYKEYYHIKPNKLSIAGIVSSIWDAVNDPIIGSWMDRKKMGPKQWRTIMRISAVTGNLFHTMKMLDGGMTEWQHVIVLIVLNCMQDIIGTMDMVAGQKLRAGISPYSQQRARTQVWNSVGSQCGYPVANIPMLLMGLRDVFHLNDYQIIVMGAVIMLPFNIISAYMITYIRQRVDFRAGKPMNSLPYVPDEVMGEYPKDKSDEELDAELLEAQSKERMREEIEKRNAVFAEAQKEYKAKLATLSGKERKAFQAQHRAERDEHIAKREYEYVYMLDPETGEPAPSILESFELIKHNKYFLVNTAANFITVFSPSVDGTLIYRYLIPKFKFFGKEISGELVSVIKEQLVGLPVTFLKPFTRQLVNACGGPLNVHKLTSLAGAVGFFLRFLIGYNTFPKVILNILIEAVLYVLYDMDGTAGTMLNYEMLDYVELKTGLRTEGVTASVNGLFSKIVTNNIGMVTGNAFLEWTGYTGGYVDSGKELPKRFVKYMWPMYTLAGVVDNLVWLAARSLVKHTPEDAKRVEEELAARHAEVHAQEEAVSQT